MKTRLKKTFFALTLCCLLIGCRNEPPALMRIGTNTWPGYEPVYLGQDLGLFGDSRIRPVKLPSSTETMAAFRRKTIEAAALTLDEALTLAQFDDDFAIVLIADISNGADVLLGRPEAKSLKDLRGKRIGVETTAVGAYMLARALQQAGLKQDDVKVVGLGAHEHEASFRAGKIDAVVTFEPVRTRLLASGARLLFDSSRIPNEILDVIIVRRDYLKKHPAVVANFVRGWFRALSYMSERPSDAAEKMKGRLKLNAAEVLAVYRGLHLPDWEDNYLLLAGERPEVLDAAKKIQDVMLEYRLLLKRVDASKLIDREQVRKIYEQH